MKCIRIGTEVKRVSDEAAAKAVQQGASYVSKQVWKKEGRK